MEWSGLNCCCRWRTRPIRVYCLQSITAWSDDDCTFPRMCQCQLSQCLCSTKKDSWLLSFVGCLEVRLRCVRVILALNLPLILQLHTRLRLRGKSWVKSLISLSIREKDGGEVIWLWWVRKNGSEAAFSWLFLHQWHFKYVVITLVFPPSLGLDHPGTKILDFPAFLSAQLPLNTWGGNTEQKVDPRPLQSLPIWF